MTDSPTSPSSCPSGGRFYTCSSRHMGLGCCTPEPCNPRDGCQSFNSELANLNITYAGEGYCRAGRATCENTTLLLMDCCTSDSTVCIQLCPQEDLPSAYLDFDLDVAPNLTLAAASSISHMMFSATSSPVSTDTADAPGGAISETYTAQNPAASTSVATESAPTRITTGQSALQTTKPVPKSNTAAIAGGVAGAIVGLALLLAFLAICCRRRTNRPQQRMDQGRSPTWSSGQARAIQPDDAELDEMKQGQFSSSSPLPLPPPPPSPLLQSSPLLPPPAYTAYRLHGNELDRLPNPSQSSASSLYSSHDLPSPESPPSSPPLQTRLSQHLADRYSDEQSISPISSHYQHQ